MRTRLITAGLLSLLLVGALWGAAARAQVLDTNLEITEFVMKPVDTPHSYPATQAGGNPDVSLFFRFCGPGLAVDNVVVDPAPTLGKFIVTTKSAHQVVNPFTFVKMRGVRNPGGVNGVWTAQPITSTGGAIDPVRFRLVNQTRPPDSDDAFAPVTADAPNGHAQIAASNDFYGCTGQQSKGKIADFKLKLPPGFLGNPGATLACPTHLFIASSCSDRSILGWSVTETVIDGASNFTPPTRIETPVFNVATLGLEPARLGTRQFPSEPAGPFPIKIDLRTTGDYGIDSALIDIPKNLGGPQALITQIETILCAQVPCKATDPQDPGTVAPLPPTRPFFRNPTSCKPATAKLEARSWAPNAVVDTAESTFTPTGCGDVPFDLDLKVAPATQPASTPVQNDVTLEYPEFADADIWQGAVKDVDLTLPKGLALNAGGGYGLQSCSFEQYGVDPTTLEQTTRAPAECPEGSQIGTVSVTSPALEGALSGKAFFGPVSGPGRPTEASPWNLFLLIEGAGLRVKLAGKVVVSEDGQVRNFFVNQPEVPFTRLKVSLRGGERAILTSTSTCGTSSGEAKLTAYANKSVVRTPTVENTGCTDPRPFNPVVEVAEGIPKKAGANSISRIVFSRPDGDANLTGLNLSLPAGATGSLAAAPQCPLAQAQAGTCPESTRIGTIRNTVGNGNSLLTVPGELYLSEAIQPGDAASIAVRVPAKVGPIDLGQVVLMNRIFLRDSDNGLEVQMVSKIPTMLDGVPLPIRRVEILVDRPGFFLNPTGCEPRTLTATFFGEGGEQSSSNIALDATQCNELPFGPDIRLIAGGPGNTDQFDHPPFQALVTQEAGEADITNARVVLPLILRPNVPFFNEPGALCNDAQAATDTCPPKSKVGTARAFSPLLPYPIAGPVHIVQEIGNVLPKVYVYLRGPTGLEVLLKARNSFLQGRRIINTFESVPDLPQSYFELNLNGGPQGILNNFEDLCQATDSDRRFDATFTSHSGKQATTQPRLEIRGCEESDLRAASLSSQSVRLSKKGVAKVKVRCKRKKRCGGRVTLRGKGVTGAGNFKISGGKTARVKVKFSKSEVKKVRKAKRMRTKATLKIADAVAGKSSVTLVGPRR